LTRAGILADMWKPVQLSKPIPLPPRRRVVRLAAVATLAAVVICAASITWMRLGARSRTYTVETVPPAPVALVFGNMAQDDGRPGPFLAARLELARQLYATGKVGAVLVSGDHGQPDYDEVTTMASWLVEQGVPNGKVVEDHAGFDTYDSCVRARKIFGVRRAVVVTQDFHLPRAVTICRSVGVDVTGVGDDTARRYRVAWWYGAVREQPASVKAAVTLILRPNPTFLGRHETGVEDAVRG
jgi:vancomycin permeability regulator SanA